MLKNIFYKVILANLFLCLSAFKTETQPIVYITLQNQALSIIPKEFYIASVDDERKDNTKIGNLQPFANTPDGQTKSYDIDLKGGIAAIKNFVSYSVPLNKDKRPIVIKLKMLNITEAPVNNGLVNGRIKLVISFYLQKEEAPVHLVDYNISTAYQRRPGPAQHIEPLLRSALSNSLVYLNNWMDAQAGINIKLAQSVKLLFVDYTEPIEGDTIYYNINRPLTWADFLGKQQLNSRHAAEVFSGIGYDESVKLIKGVIRITLAIKVYAPKSACWATPGIMNIDNLTHEQRHFDIAKIVGERFKHNLKAEKLPVDNYDGPINVVYFDTLRELDKMQKMYDEETQHSKDTYRQQLWNIRIDNELLKLGLKKEAR